MKKLLIITTLVISMTACKKDNKPDDASIFDYSVTGISQSGFVLDTAYIDEPDKTIYLLFANSISSGSFPLDITANFSVTTGATALPATGSTITFNNIDDRSHYIVTATDGTKIDYSVVVRDDQIPDADFEQWYSTQGMNGGSFYEPGLSAKTTVWATANMGTSTFGVYCTTPVTTDGNTVAKIVTGETSLVPVTAGTIFTGKFNVDEAINHPTDPIQATTFGIPFSLRPYSVNFRYSYQPGNRYIQATLKNSSNIFGGFTVTDIPGTDMFTAYAVLERRTGTGIIEIARAEMVSGDVQDVMKEVTIPFTYTSDEKPTHIYVVFSSSKDGDLWRGAVGSTLIIDDVNLVYQ
jgi:hypothetical protein